MTIHQLQIFHAVCQELNYSTAADKCFISRQALRQSIAALEKELGGALFANRANHISLTDKGVRLQQESALVVQEFERLERVMQEENQNKTCIRLGISESLFPDYLPELEDDIDLFAERFASLRVDARFAPNDDLSGAVLRGDLDCALALDLQVSADGILRGEICSHQAAVFCSPQCVLAGRKELSLQELSGWTACIPGTGPEFSPLTEADGLTIAGVPRYYQALYLVCHEGYLGLSRYIQKDYKKNDVVKLVPLVGCPPLCCSFLMAKSRQAAHLFLLRDFLKQRILSYFIRFTSVG